MTSGKHQKDVCNLLKDFQSPACKQELLDEHGLRLSRPRARPSDVVSG